MKRRQTMWCVERTNPRGAPFVLLWTARETRRKCIRGYRHQMLADATPTTAAALSTHVDREFRDGTLRAVKVTVAWEARR